MSLAQVNVNELKAKFSSKKDIYLFLSAEVGAYLPPCSLVSIYFLKDLMRGSKKVSLLSSS